MSYLLVDFGKMPLWRSIVGFWSFLFPGSWWIFMMLYPVFCCFHIFPIYKWIFMIVLNRWNFMIALFCCFHDWLLDGFSWFFLNDGFSWLVYLCRCSLLLLGGFGHASHPALIPAGAALSHLDPEVSTSETYSQVRDIPTYNLQICIKWNLRYGTASGNILRTIAPMFMPLVYFYCHLYIKN